MAQQILIPQRPVDLGDLVLDRERLNALRAATASTRAGTAKTAEVNALLKAIGGGGGGGAAPAAPGTVAGTPPANLNALNQLAGPGSAATSPGGPAAGGGQNAMNALLAADPATALQVQKFQTGAATEQRASREDTLKTTARELAQINALPANRRAQAYQDLLGRTRERGIDMEGIPQEFNQPFVDASIAAAQQAGFLEPTRLLSPEEEAQKARIAAAGSTTIRFGTESQGKAATFASRMEAANQIIDGLEEIGSDPASAFTNLLPNALKPDELQALDTAARDFTGAILRKESGAAVPPSEIAEAFRVYIPRPGDGTNTLAIKRGNRARAIQNMRREAGPVKTISEVPGIVDPTPELGKFGGMTPDQLRGVDIDSLSAEELDQLETAFDKAGV